MAYSIVVGYDGSAHSSKALDAAIEWAKRGSTTVRSSSPAPRTVDGPGVGFRGPDFGVEEMWDTLQKKIEGELEQAAARVKAAGSTRGHSLHSRPSRRDHHQRSPRVGAKLIVVGAKGAGARKGQRTVLGSTTTKVLHEAAGIPVLVV